MNRDNENASTPDVNDESVFNPHPFTEDEPVTSGPAGTDQVTGEPLPPEGDEPLLPADDEPLRPEAEEPLPLDADEPIRAESDEPVRSGTGEPMRSGMGQGTAASGTAGGQPVDVSQLGPLFDGSEATEFQQNWQQIRSEEHTSELQSP